jgi:hypothetical protein
MADDDDGIGFTFYLKLAGAVLAGGLVLLVLLLLFSRAVYAWGFFGAFLALSIILLAFGWIYDRREARRYETEAS